MDYKEKYEMALEGIQEILGSGEESIKMSRLQLRLQGIFPELKENKDEDILKGLISMCKTLGKTKWVAWLENKSEQKPVPDWMPKFLDELRSKKNYFDWDENKDIEGQILAIIKWMNPNYFNEKQGGQKPIVPKFKVGDWVIDKQGLVHQITNVIENVTNHTYAYDVAGGGYD